MWGLLWFSCEGAPTPAPLATVGQWIWSDADVVVFRDSLGSLPRLVPTIWISTVSARDDHLDNRLGYSPLTVEGPRAVLFRIDDSVHELWETHTTDALASELDAKMGRTLALLADRGIDPVEVQLDYDCPVRRLPQWAAVLSKLKTGSLSGETVWVTSLVAHLRAPGYGDLLRGVVSGHILQVFDTGDAPVDASDVGALALRAQMPYRMGLGAFEREREGIAVTDHIAWFSRLDDSCLSPWCEGAWVFPAGRPWVAYLREAK